MGDIARDGPPRVGMRRPTPPAETPSSPSSSALDWAPNAIAVVMALGAVHLWTAYLRRIPGSSHIRPSFFRRRSLFGRVTSVGDGDGFHMFHTPGGRWAGWGWLRRVPRTRAALRGKTVRPPALGPVRAAAHVTTS
jgi:hypothetical protein